jgi:hypothetical protein
MAKQVRSAISLCCFILICLIAFLSLSLSLSRLYSPRFDDSYSLNRRNSLQEYLRLLCKIPTVRTKFESFREFLEMPIDKIKQVKDDYFPHYDFNNIDDPSSPRNTQDTEGEMEDSRDDNDDMDDLVTDLSKIKTVPMKLSLHPGYNEAGGGGGGEAEGGRDASQEEEDEEGRGGPIGEIEHGGKSSLPSVMKKKEPPESIDRYQSTSNPAYRTKQQQQHRQQPIEVDNNGEIRESDPRFEDGGSFEDYQDEDDEDAGDYDYHDFTQSNGAVNHSRAAVAGVGINRGKGKSELRSNSHSPPPSSSPRNNSNSDHNYRGSDSSNSPPRSSNHSEEERTSSGALTTTTKGERKVKKGNDRFSYRDSVLETALGQEFDDDGEVIISRP